MLTLTPIERHLVGRVPPGQVIPVYASAEFDALDDQDPRRAASIIRAAAAWREHCSPERVADDLRRQLAEEDAAVWRRIRGVSADVAAARDWAAASRSPTFAELQRRRGVA